MILFRWTALLTLCFSILYPTSSPSLSPIDCYYKSKEIMSYHIKYKEFNGKIVQRTVSNFIDSLDPTKTYLTLEDIHENLHLDNEVQKNIVKNFQNKKFVYFSSVYLKMAGAMQRRHAIDQEIAQMPENEILQQSECNLKDWSSNTSELKRKLMYIRKLQLETRKKIPKAGKDLFFQRIEKRQKSFEDDFVFQDKKECEKHVHVLFLKSLANALDNHTCYFTPEEAKRFLVDVQQRLFGIGALLRDDLDGFTITQIVEGGPVDRSNILQLGDKILAVDNKPVVGMDLIDVVDMIRGPKNTKVELTIVRSQKSGKEEIFDVAIIRDELVLKETRLTKNNFPYGDGVILHLALHSFYQDETSSSAKDLRDEIEKVRSKEKIHGIILDLRSNGGGPLMQAVSVTGLFIQKGIVTSIQTTNSPIQHIRHLGDQMPYDYPLIVLINRASASASEIVSMSLSDYGRALVVGDSESYGKGTYQSISFGGNDMQKVNPLGEYKVTGGLYYTVGGKSPQLVGVKSDVFAPGIYNYLDIGERHTKYPLKNSCIGANFEDNLSDVHPLYRSKMRKLLANGSQKPSPWIREKAPLLSQNSQKRIDANENYTAFIQQIKATDTFHLDTEETGKEDLQLLECVAVMKELIYLQKSAS